MAGNKFGTTVKGAEKLSNKVMIIGEIKRKPAIQSMLENGIIGYG